MFTHFVFAVFTQFYPNQPTENPVTVCPPGKGESIGERVWDAPGTDRSITPLAIRRGKLKKDAITKGKLATQEAKDLRKNSSAIVVDEENFEKEVINSPHPTLVFASAVEYCAACQNFHPIYEKALNAPNRFKWTVLYMGTEEDWKKSHKILSRPDVNILTVPTVVLFHEGKAVGRAEGSTEFEALLKQAESLIKK